MTEAQTLLIPIDEAESMAARVERRLKKAILSGELPPGSHLSVPELARRLGVSRTPVREAVAALERSGLALMRPRQGAVVFGGDRDDLAHFYELREALDGMAARLAATRMSSQERRALRGVMKQHTDAVRRKDLEAHVALDLEFHRLVSAGAHNPRLAQDLERLRDQILLVLRSVASDPGAVGRGVLHDHNAILGAILDESPDEAEQAARSHVRAVLEFVLDSTYEAAFT